jgi:nucleotidyltransferase/DNA polymerase involved in DNA repair
VERISIDETFSDVAGCTHLFGPPAEIASAIRRRPRAVLGFPISAGAARTKRLSRYYELHIWRTGLFAILPLAIIPMMG